MQVREACRSAATSIASAIQDTVNSLPYRKRTQFGPSILKPEPEVAAWPDAVGEQVAVQHLSQLSASINYPIHLIMDPCAGTHLVVTSDKPLTCCSVAAEAAAAENGLGPDATQAADPGTAALRVVWCYLDAVDDTLKLSGLFNQQQQQPDRLRLVNDGAWAVGIAFTDPTDTPLQQLRLRHFTTAAIADGNPPRHKCYPVEVVASTVELGPHSSQQSDTAAPTQAATATAAGQCGLSVIISTHSYQTVEHSTGSPLFTTSCENLSHCFAYLDSFQAHDIRTAGSTDADLAVRLYRLLMDRHRGGAFDVLRQYGNLGSLLRTMLGWRGCEAQQPVQHNHQLAQEQQSGEAVQAVQNAAKETWLEAQCGLFVVINENLANLIPAVPIILGAGGVATDLEGASLLDRTLGDGRVSVVYAANEALHAAAMQLIQAARQGELGG